MNSPQDLVDPVDVALEMIHERLPNLEKEFNKHRQALRISGNLPIAMEASPDPIYMMVPYPATLIGSPVVKWIRDATETDSERELRLAEELLKEKARVRRYLEVFVTGLVDKIQQFGIDSFSLQGPIDAMIRDAVDVAKRAAKQEGYEKGLRDGRKAMLAELLELSGIDKDKLRTLL